MDEIFINPLHYTKYETADTFYKLIVKSSKYLCLCYVCLLYLQSLRFFVNIDSHLKIYLYVFRSILKSVYEFKCKFLVQNTAQLTYII